MPSSREKAVKRVGEEIMDLLSKPTAKEKSLADKFKSQGGNKIILTQILFIFNSFLYISFTLYPTHSRIGRGN